MGSPAPADSAFHESDLRSLGQTGARVLAVSLGGEGILRTTGRSKEAVPVILEALRLGVRYCDTAPAYQQSQDYYGAAFREAGRSARDKIFLASKVHPRTRDAALRLLDDSLMRLGTDRLDLWQLHDIRDGDDLAAIFGKDGALKAALTAQSEGRVRFVGLTGHHDPAILLEAMRRHPFDSVLCALNPADPRRLPFMTSVVADARKRGIGVVGMKVMAAGRCLADRAATPAELIRYAASRTDTVIVGCSSVAEVRANLGVAREFEPMSPGEGSELERRIAPRAARYDYFKAD
jgi:aryl-alcohol dehydrogenase-like predicted oxidoreductase